MVYTVSSIPWSADLPVNFPLQSATEYVSAMGLHPETIVSRLSKKLGGRLAYNKNSYRTIVASEEHIDIIRKGYQGTWDKHTPSPLLLATLPSTLKHPMFSIQKLLGFPRKEPSVRSPGYNNSMLVHTLQYLNL